MEAFVLEHQLCMPKSLPIQKTPIGNISMKIAIGVSEGKKKSFGFNQGLAC
jgi:hypothetical protein